jgi:hypothetical protein
MWVCIMPLYNYILKQNCLSNYTIHGAYIIYLIMALCFMVFGLYISNL